MAFILPVFFAALGCQGGNDSGASRPGLVTGNHPPVIHTASIQPSPLILNGPVSVAIDAQDIDRNPLSFRYRWMINEQAVLNEPSEHLRPELLKRGDRVSVEIWPHDGIVEGASFMTPVATVGNSPPVVSHLSIEPAVVVPGLRIRVSADVSDADHDFTRTTFRWWRNDGLLHEGEETELDTSSFTRGNTLSVEAIASDGTSTSQPARLDKIKIGNTAPRIASVPTTSLDQGRFSYQIEAYDDEADALKFSLETSPAGMTIDERKGLITWQVPAGQTGKHKVRVLVTDSPGAASFQEFEIDIGVASPPGKA